MEAFTLAGSTRLSHCKSDWALQIPLSSGRGSGNPDFFLFLHLCIIYYTTPPSHTDKCTVLCRHCRVSCVSSRTKCLVLGIFATVHTCSLHTLWLSILVCVTPHYTVWIVLLLMILL